MKIFNTCAYSGFQVCQLQLQKELQEKGRKPGRKKKNASRDRGAFVCLLKKGNQAKAQILNIFQTMT